MSEMTDRLAAAKLRKAEAEAKREARREAEAPIEAAEAAERAAIDAEALDAAEIAHGRVATVQTLMGLVILKMPGIVRFKRFRDQGESRFDEIDSFVRTCLVHPDPVAYEAITQAIPGTVDRCGNAVCELAGYVLRELQGKS